MTTLAPHQRDHLHGPLPWAATVAWLSAGAAWLGWPLWWSITAPGREAQQEATRWVLAALLALLLLLGWTLWLRAGRRLHTLAPLALLVLVAVFLRVAVNPSGAGIEFALVVPLLAGAAFGGPAGVLTGALAAAASAFMTDTVAAPLPGQMFVWALWGLAGGLLRRLPTPAAWLTGTIVCLPMGVASGLLLNLTGWATAEGVTTGAFIPGLGPIPQLLALWAYSVDTSLAWDISRGVSTAIALAVLGLPVLRTLRSVAPPQPPHPSRRRATAPVPSDSRSRRQAAQPPDPVRTDERPTTRRNP